MSRFAVFIAAVALVAAGCNENGLTAHEETLPPAELGVAPASLEFGITLLGEAPVRTFTIANVAAAGAADLTVTSIHPAGDLHFAVIAAPLLPLVLAPGESAEVTVAYAPDVHLEENAGSIVVEHGAAPGLVSATGSGILCEPLSVLQLQQVVPSTNTADLAALYGIDPEFELYYAPNYLQAVRFASQKIGCVWVDEGASFVGLSGSADTQAPWGVDNAVVIEFLDLQENRIGWAYGGDGYLSGMRYIPTGELLPQLATASIPGPDVGVPNPNGMYGFPARGAGAFNLLSNFTVNEPVIFRLNTLDEGAVGSVTDLHLFADY